jgi:hypothetical protein
LIFIKKYVIIYIENDKRTMLGSLEWFDNINW